MVTQKTEIVRKQRRESTATEKVDASLGLKEKGGNGGQGKLLYSKRSYRGRCNARVGKGKWGAKLEPGRRERAFTGPKTTRLGWETISAGDQDKGGGWTAGRLRGKTRDKTTY